MSEQTRTPRTQAAIKRIRMARNFSGDVVAPAFAETLELELEKKHAEIVALREAVVNCEHSDICSVNLCLGECDCGKEKALSTQPPPVVSKAQYDELQQRLEDAYSIIKQNAREDVRRISALADKIINPGPCDGFPSPPVVPLEDVRPLVDVLLEVAELDAGEQPCIASDAKKALATFTAKHPIK